MCKLPRVCTCACVHTGRVRDRVKIRDALLNIGWNVLLECFMYSALSPIHETQRDSAN